MRIIVAHSLMLRCRGFSRASCESLFRPAALPGGGGRYSALERSASEKSVQGHASSGSASKRSASPVFGWRKKSAQEKSAKREVAELLGEEEPRSIRERLRRKEYEKQRTEKQELPQRKKNKDRGWER